MGAKSRQRRCVKPFFSTFLIFSYLWARRVFFYTLLLVLWFLVANLHLVHVERITMMVMDMMTFSSTIYSHLRGNTQEIWNINLWNEFDTEQSFWTHMCGALEFGFYLKGEPSSISVYYIWISFIDTWNRSYDFPCTQYRSPSVKSNRGQSICRHVNMLQRFHFTWIYQKFTRNKQDLFQFTRDVPENHKMSNRNSFL